MYHSGKGVPKDYAEAVKWLLKAAEQGYADAQLAVAIAYHIGEGVSQDDAEAVKWLRKAAEQGYAEAQYHLAKMYSEGQGVPQDNTEAIKWYRKAAEKRHMGSVDALAALSGMGTGVSKPEANVKKESRRKDAEQGHGGAVTALNENESPEAQFNLGARYYTGTGKPQDYAEAVKWYRKAADQGHGMAQNNLGVMYSKGQGVPQDYAEAVDWYRKAAKQGNSTAQSNLGTMYEKGQGVPQDYGEAVKWYRKATEQGNAEAQFNLGVMYEKGHGVPQNNTEAMNWYRKAADQRFARAQDALAALSKRESDAEESRRKATEQRDANLGRSTEILLKKQGGVYELPVRINGVITLKFILDTGASEVNIPADVALTLWRTGTIGQGDFLPGQSYELADGSTLKSSRFIIRELDVGGIKISQVPASIMPATGSLLLGQSFLGRLESWAMDNKRHVLIIRGVK
jgi:uncharacterized protein